MNHVSRRRFLGQSLSTAAAAYWGLNASNRTSAKGANDEIRVAVAGIHNQGNGHIGRFQSVEGVLKRVLFGGFNFFFNSVDGLLDHIPGFERFFLE